VHAADGAVSAGCVRDADELASARAIVDALDRACTAGVVPREGRKPEKPRSSRARRISALVAVRWKPGRATAWR